MCAHLAIPGFQHEFWGFDVGFHAYKANTSLAEPSSQPLDSFEAVTYPEMHSEFRGKGSFQIVGQGRGRNDIQAQGSRVLLQILPRPACVSPREHSVSPLLSPLLGEAKESICHWDRRVWGCHSSQLGNSELKGPKVPVFADAFSGYVKCPFPPQPAVFKENICADLRLLSLAEEDSLTVQCPLLAGPWSLLS